MHASSSSKTSRASKNRFPWWTAPAIVLALAGAGAAAVAYVQARGWTLYYGDAMAHLNIARRILDSRAPGWEQVGTVWLPLPHLLMLPLVSTDWLWRTGLAGAIVSCICFVIAGTFLFLAARKAFSSDAAGAVAAFALALNPNVLYLQATPMTETVFLACFAGLLYFTVLFRDSQSLWAAAAAGLCALAGTMTRYEGWFLLPFCALYILLAAKRRRLLAAALFSVIASSGPLLWFAHNWWYYGDALEFYHGQWSAKAIYERALAAGMARYPGDHDWAKAWLYFREDARLVAGWPLAVLGVAGIAAALVKRAFWTVALLALVPAFYVWSVHSGSTPIFLPHLWPNSYYNSRYAIGALPLLALGAAALASLAPARFRRWAAVAVVAAAAAPWVMRPAPENWVCWKESQVNSVARRAWTAKAARYLAPRYGARDGVFTSFGDLAGIFLEAGLPLRTALHEGIRPEWETALARPDLFLHERWVIAISGDKVATAIERLPKDGPRYDLLEAISVKGAPVIKIYRRTDGYSIYEGARREERLSADVGKRRPARQPR